MKKLLLLLMALTSLAANAQDVDETMPVGRRVKTSFLGEFVTACLAPCGTVL